MNTTGNKFGGRTKGTPNKLTSKIKDKLSSIIIEAIDSLDLETMTKSERLKLIQLGLPYIVILIVFIIFSILAYLDSTL